MNYNLSAQEIKINSFNVLEADLTARVSNAKKYDNTKIAAIIKVVTPEVGFSFDIGENIIIDVINKPGEIWVYVPRGISKIIISHPNFGKCIYFFDLYIENAMTYELNISAIHKSIDNDILNIENDFLHAERLYFGRDVERDYKTAFDLFYKLAKKGHVLSQYYVGECYALGKGVEANVEVSVKWYQLAAEQGNYRAANKLGLAYYYGIDQSLDPDKIYKLVKIAAEGGYDDAMVTLGSMCEQGKCVAQNYEQAAKWFSIAAEQGNKLAQYNLGRLFENGTGVDQNYYIAVNWYRKAANADLEAAQCNLARCYHLGIGVIQSYKEAYNWYLKSASSGFSEAQHAISIYYRDGLGVRADENEFLIWCRKAVEQNHPNAMLNLAASYTQGSILINKDLNKALELIEQAAEIGGGVTFAFIQCMLGALYEFGEVEEFVVDKDINRAKYWYNKAAQYGDDDALEALKRLK